ncbi:hypothetical protein [Cellulomonas cellasea]|uniref:Uncharacterized protein n=1 Tax=Cellulomonas cellasea TaxID=43670 RepID=A0A4Y3KXN9_9CELL|nr:hypothetical protein [Cellulomonas cellasea]GEA88224.1 hypothetical protein CCE01nite_21730 [Cellulomonas cellasea]
MTREPDTEGGTAAPGARGLPDHLDLLAEPLRAPAREPRLARPDVPATSAVTGSAGRTDGTRGDVTLSPVRTPAPLAGRSTDEPAQRTVPGPAAPADGTPESVPPAGAEVDATHRGRGEDVGSTTGRAPAADRPTDEAPTPVTATGDPRAAESSRSGPPAVQPRATDVRPAAAPPGVARTESSAPSRALAGDARTEESSSPRALAGEPRTEPAPRPGALSGGATTGGARTPAVAGDAAPTVAARPVGQPPHAGSPRPQDRPAFPSVSGPDPDSTRVLPAVGTPAGPDPRAGVADPVHHGGGAHSGARPGAWTPPPHAAPEAPAARHRRRPWPVIVLAMLFALTLALATYLVVLTRAHEERAAEWEQVARTTGTELTQQRAELEGVLAELEAVRAQLTTAQARITELADEKAQIGDEREAQRQLVDYQARVSEAAGKVAGALDTCVDGQFQLISYLENAAAYDAADLARFRTDVQRVCGAARDANAALQLELER